MEDVKTLIDKAAAVCGSRYALAQRLEVSESNLCSILKGRRTMPVRMAARLAVIAGVDPREALVAATLSGTKDPSERAELERVFFRGAVHGVAVMLLSGIIALCLMPSNAIAHGYQAVPTFDGTKHSRYLRKLLAWAAGAFGRRRPGRWPTMRRVSASAALACY